MAESDREKRSGLPDQTEEIKEREREGEREKLKEPQEDYPVKEVERDEKADEKGRKSIKDIPAGKEKTKGDSDDTR